MPTYEYACLSCGKHIDVVQAFTDAALTECPTCEGPLRKIFGNVGIVFKGSGFYKTDSRGKSPEATSSSSTPTESQAAKNDKPASAGEPDKGSSPATTTKDSPSPKTSATTPSVASSS